MDQQCQHIVLCPEGVHIILETVDIYPNSHIIGLAYFSARKDYMQIRELPAERGFADMVFLPLPSCGKPALVVELKYDKTARAAIQHIKDRQYTQALEGYVGEILLVGINYDKDNKNKPHTCIIEKVEKLQG